MRELGGRVAVVTGAASGIGAALAAHLAGAGMALVLADIEPDPLAATCDTLKADGADVIGVPTDVADAASVQALAAAALARHGAVHLMCNNAGVSGLVGRTWQTPAEDWEWVFGVNVRGVVNGIRSFLPILLEQDEGYVLNTGSAACFEALPGMGAYGASKHAVLGISEALSRELSGTSVGVTVLIPGGIVRSRIMSSERNWPAHLGAAPDVERDPVSQMVRTGFAAAIDAGTDPGVCAKAAIDGVLAGRFLVSDDPNLLETWAGHAQSLAGGDRPAWPG